MATELISGLVPFLRANAAVLATSGGVIAQDFLPDGVSEGISFLQVGDAPRPTFNSFGRHSIRVQFSFSAPTADAQNAMARAVYQLFNAFQQGQLPGGVFLTGVRYLTGRGGRSEATLQHAATADYLFLFNDPR